MAIARRGPSTSTSTSTTEGVTRRTVRARGSMAATHIAMTTAADGSSSRFEISEAADGEARAWVLRLHLRPGQKAVAASVDGVALAPALLQHIAPHATGFGYFPFGGKDAAPAPGAGHVVQIALPSAASARTAEVHIA